MSSENFKMNIMKSKMTVFIITLFLSVCSLSGNAQTTIPKGKAQLIEFTNATAKFSVPTGKTWILYNAFSDYCTDMKPTEEGGLTAASIRIFIKSINDIPKTDITKKIYGTQLFMSRDAGKTIGMPIILPENTKFELVLIVGDEFKNFKLYTGIGYLSIIETDN